MNLKFEEVTEGLFSVLPEWKERYESALGSWWSGTEQPGQYVVFGFVVTPGLKDLLRSEAGTRQLQCVFEFLEQMAQSSDIQVVNLLQISVFEWLIDDPVLLAKAWKYMGSKTKEVARKTARILGRERNVPTHTTG